MVVAVVSVESLRVDTLCYTSSRSKRQKVFRVCAAEEARIVDFRMLRPKFSRLLPRFVVVLLTAIRTTCSAVPGITALILY